MNLYDKSSLVLIPSGIKDGKIYSQRPENGDGDFTFSRSTSATRVGPSGLIEKETQNLLLQSNSFDVIWPQPNSSVTGGQSGYDGSSDAWLLEKSGVNGRIYQNISTSGVQTFSVYAKAAVNDWAFLLVNGGANPAAWFDLSTGSLGTATGGIINHNISDVGNGWYKISITFDETISRVRIYVADADNDTSGTSGSIYIQDVQLEQGLVARDYIETTTTAVYGGITDNIPRLDYTDASCPSLLLEPQRTNKLTHSEYINTSTFNQTANLTIENNYSTSPEGYNNAARITPTTTNSYHQLRTSQATLDGYDIVGCFVKADGYDYVQLTSWAQPSNYINFNLTDGSVGAIGSIGPTIYGIDDYGNGWYRIYANVKANGSGLIGIGVVTSSTAGWAQAFAGNGTDGVLIYGCQLEAETYPTSYIPTYGSAVTRNVETCIGAGNSSTFNPNEGVFYAEISTNTDSTDKTLSLNNDISGSNNNRLWMGYSTSAKRVYALGYVNNALQFVLSKLMTDETLFVKIACKYALNNVSFFVNGEKVGTDTSALAFTELTSVDFNIGLASGSGPFYGNAKQVLVFNQALSDAECITLTTL